MSKEQIMEQYWKEFLEWFKNARISGSREVEDLLKEGKYNINGKTFESIFWCWYMEFKLAPSKPQEDK